jgi:hypothetical protein
MIIYWNKILPSNISIFAWRLFLNRKDNLIRRDLVYLDSSQCVGGCEMMESFFFFAKKMDAKSNHPKMYQKRKTNIQVERT